jgi:hypothetical protein
VARPAVEVNRFGITSQHHVNMIRKKLAHIFRIMTGGSREGLYEPVLADSEREAVADLLQYLENVSGRRRGIHAHIADQTS